MTYVAALVSVVCFAIAFQGLGILSVARRAIQSGLDTSRIMRDSLLSDDDKERAARGASLVLLRCFGSIAVRSAVAVGVSFLPLLLFDLVGLARISSVNSLLISWTGVLFAAAAIVLMCFARARH